MAYVHRDHLVHMLAANFTTADISAKLGVEEAAVVSAIQDDENIAYDVARQKHYRQIDKNLDQVEATASARLLQQIGMETDTMKLLKVTTGVNAARRRSQGETADFARQGSASAPSAKLRLPKRIAVEHDVNKNNEVVSVNDRALVSMSGQELLNTLKGDDVERIEQEEQRLPKQLTEEEEEELRGAL